jgi:hypothetical protein
MPGTTGVHPTSGSGWEEPRRARLASHRRLFVADYLKKQKLPQQICLSFHAHGQVKPNQALGSGAYDQRVDIPSARKSTETWHAAGETAWSGVPLRAGAADLKFLQQLPQTRWELQIEKRH